MAVRQHILPRFLLKGFASRVKKKEVYAWVYPKVGDCFETNIINIAVEKYFYGKDGEGTVDDKLTNFESNFAPLLDELRFLKNGEEVDRTEVASFISHLEIRTKHVRESFQKPCEFMVGEMGKYLSNIDNIKSALAGDQRFDKNLSAMPKVLEEMILFATKKFFSEVEVATPAMIKKGHIQALSENVVPEWKMKRYRKLHWYVCGTEQVLILGDVGAILEVTDDRKFISVSLKDDTIKKVFLPISKNKVLVGTSLPQAPKVSASTINLQAARLSREFFVSSIKSAGVAGLVEQIGQNAEIFSKDELGEKVRRKLNL